MKRSLTFDGLEAKADSLENDLYASLFSKNKPQHFNIAYFENALDDIHEIIKNRSDGLYESLILDLKHKVKILVSILLVWIFVKIQGYTKRFLMRFFASKNTDYVEGIPENFSQLDAKSRHQVLTSVKGDVPVDIFESTITKETLGSIRAMRKIQEQNGERGCNRYIISNCQTIDNLLELFALHKICDWDKPSVDIIPLFETIP